MFCSHCGNRLKDGARFCSACGTPVDVDETTPAAQSAESIVITTEETVPDANSNTRVQAGFVGQMESDRKRSRKKLSPLMIVALVLSLLAATAFAALFITQQAGQDEQVPEQAQPGETQNTDVKTTGEDKREPTSKQPTFDQAQAEAEALAAAEAAGKQVVSGTVHVTTFADRAKEVNFAASDFDGNTDAFVVLLLDEPTELYAMSTKPTKPIAYTTDSIALAASYDKYNLPTWGDLSGWTALDGQRATIAFSGESVRWFSDSTGVLAPLSAKDAERIAPLSESPVSTQESAGASNAADDYVLPDSATRAYKRKELSAMDDHTLFLARNEIYARHGRKFKSEELQRYFGSKTWYKPTIASDSFTDGMLNDVELANVHLMLEIESARGSQYI